jgi:hypothetical protein
MSKLQRQRQSREASVTPQRANPAAAVPARSAAVLRHAPGAVVQRAMAAPHSLQPSEFLAIQRTLGNNAAGTMLGRTPVQAKLTINAPGDRWEREANRIADSVMLSKDEPAGPQHSPSVMPEQNTTQVSEGSVAAAEDFAHQLQASQGRLLPPALRERFEGKLGADFGGVRVHTDAAAGRLSGAIQAQAFTRGPDIFVGPGHYAPGTAAGQRLLAHELAHVVQQGAAPPEGAVGPSPVTRAGRSGAQTEGPIQRKLNWLDTDWSQAAETSVSASGRWGTLFVRDDKPQNDPVVVKSEELPAEAALGANLRPRQEGKKWTIVAPGARMANDGEGKTIKDNVERTLRTDLPDYKKQKAQNIIDKLEGPGTVIYEFAPGRDLQDLIFSSAYLKNTEDKNISPKELNKFKEKSLAELNDLLGRKSFWRTLGEIAAVDIFTGNTDRITGKFNPENLKINENKTIWLIDNVEFDDKSQFNWEKDQFWAEQIILTKQLKDDQYDKIAETVIDQVISDWFTTIFVQGSSKKPKTPEEKKFGNDVRQKIVGKGEYKKAFAEGVKLGKQRLPNVAATAEESVKNPQTLSSLQNRLNFIMDKDATWSAWEDTAPKERAGGAYYIGRSRAFPPSTATTATPTTSTTTEKQIQVLTEWLSEMMGQEDGPTPGSGASTSATPITTPSSNVAVTPTVPVGVPLGGRPAIQKPLVPSKAAKPSLNLPGSGAATSATTITSPRSNVTATPTVAVGVPKPPVPSKNTKPKPTTISTPVIPTAPSPITPASLPPQLGATMTTAGRGYEDWSLGDLLKERDRLISAGSSSAASKLAAVEAELRKYNLEQYRL